MIKSLPKPSKLYASDPCTVIWSENDQRQSQNFMKTLPNSANQVSFTFTSLNSKEKHSSMRSLKTSMLQRQQPVQLPQAYPQHRFRCLRASEKLGKEFWATPQKRSQRTFNNRANQYNQRGDTSSGG
jgi:hypothetical protein